MRQFIAIAALCTIVAGPLAAQDRAETLADIRQDLTVLYVELQRLKQELNTTGSAATNLAGTSIPDRVDTLEAEVRRLTSKTEELQNRIDRIVADGTNRIGDLEFLVQYLVLRHAADEPSVIEFTDNIRQLDALATCGVVPPDTAARFQDHIHPHGALSV